jgi:hypothetical protein
MSFTIVICERFCTIKRCDDVLESAQRVKIFCPPITDVIPLQVLFVGYVRPMLTKFLEKQGRVLYLDFNKHILLLVHL